MSKEKGEIRRYDRQVTYFEDCKMREFILEFYEFYKKESTRTAKCLEKILGVKTPEITLEKDIDDSDEINNETERFWPELGIGFLNMRDKYYVYKKIPAFVLKDGDRLVKIDESRVAVPLILKGGEIKLEVALPDNFIGNRIRCPMVIEKLKHPLLPRDNAGFTHIWAYSYSGRNFTGSPERVISNLLIEAEHILKYGCVNWLKPYVMLDDKYFDDCLISESEAKNYEIIDVRGKNV